MDESGELLTIREIRIHGGKAKSQSGLRKREEIRPIPEMRGRPLLLWGFRLLDSALVHAIKCDKGPVEHTYIHSIRELLPLKLD